jgi:hypothetical protein
VIGKQPIGVRSRIASFVSLILLLAIGCGSNRATPDAGPGDGAIDTFEVDADVGSGFLIRGTAVGVRRPVTLRVDAVDKTESLVVTQDGAFTFRRRVPDQMPYAVTTTGQQLCNEPSGGTIANADAELTLVCDGVNELQSLVFDVPVALAASFDPDDLVYNGNRFPYLLETGDTVGVTPSLYYPTQTVLTIGGTPASHGQRFDLAFSTTAPLDFSLGLPGLPALDRTYRLSSNTRTLLQEAYVKASDTRTLSEFGRVALDGDTLVVGAPLDDHVATDAGAVYIYQRVGASWSQTFMAQGAAAGRRFGAAVAIAGDTVAVGAPANGSASGAVHLYRREAGGWTFDRMLVGPAPSVDDRFGAAVDVAGDSLVVGAFLHDSGAADSGTAYVFARSGGVWGTSPATLKQAAVVGGSGFGISVAIDGTSIAIGASTELDGNGLPSGAAYVFVNTGSWTLQRRIQRGGPGRFGESIDLAGDTLVVGAPSDAASEGRAYVYQRTSTTWDGGVTLAPPVPLADACLGSAVAIDRNHVVVGGRCEEGSASGIGGVPDHGADDAGAALLYRRTGTSWGTGLYIKASNTDANDRFGTSVAVDGLTMAVGAPLEASGATGVNGGQGNGTPQAGAVYVFR